MVCYDKVKNKPRVFRSLTGLNPEEFYKLLESFKKSWKDFIKRNYLDKERKRIYGGGRKSKLSSTEDKLFFILFYFKIYPLQEVIAFLFDMSQSQANEWIHKLSLVLNTSLGYENQLPERNAKNLEDILDNHIELEFMIDGTERHIQRPKDIDKQKAYYSGKKKCHTIKNNVIVGRNSIILANVLIGENAVIGAGSIVTKNVDAQSVKAQAGDEIVYTLITDNTGSLPDCHPLHDTGVHPQRRRYRQRLGAMADSRHRFHGDYQG